MIRRGLGLLFLSSLLVLTACGTDQDTGDEAGGAAEAAPAQLTIATHEFKFEADAESVPAGLVELTHQNEGKQPHQIQLFRLNDGVNFNEFKASLMKKPSGPPAGTDAGGSSEIAPGDSNTVTLELEEGAYALVCFVRGHHVKGMIQPFEVTSAEEADFEEPIADAEITLDDFAFVIPQGFDGQGTVRFTNTGSQTHEAYLAKVDASLEELQSYVQNPKGPPPGGQPEPVGSMGGLPPGGSGFVELDLEPGVYAFACFVPDQKTGKPHFELGMIGPFEVQ